MAILDAAETPTVRERVYAVLKAHLQPLTPEDVADMTGVSVSVARDALVGLSRAGKARLVSGRRFAPIYDGTV